MRAYGHGSILACLALACAAMLGCPKNPVDSVPAPPAAPAAPATPVERAVVLYDAGKYEEAKAILQPLDATGTLSGPALYRLGYTYGAAGDAAKQSEIMARALAALHTEAQKENSLEVAFFLANAQTNLGKAADARTTAADATGRVELGGWPRPTNGLDSFRLGKLYADQGRKDAATEWYGRALDRFAAEGSEYPGYTRWARRWLAQEAFARADYAEAERQYAGLAQAGGAGAPEYDRLAVARARQERWIPAQEAWREAEKLDPANSDRPRYCRNLAALAQVVGSVPTSDATGKAWSSLSKEDLERTLTEQAGRAREGRTRAEATPPPDAAEKKKIEESLQEARALFVGAALEYALRNLDIRETAFLGGYAPLIFHPEDWLLPEAPSGS